MNEEKQALTLVTAIRDGLRVQSNAVKNERSARARRAGRRAARHAGALDALLAALTALARDLETARQERDAVQDKLTLALATSDLTDADLTRTVETIAERMARAMEAECNRQIEAAEASRDAAVRAARAETLRELRAEIAEAKTGLYGEVSGVRALGIIDSKLAAREGQ